MPGVLRKAWVRRGGLGLTLVGVWLALGCATTPRTTPYTTFRYNWNQRDLPVGADAALDELAGKLAGDPGSTATITGHAYDTTYRGANMSTGKKRAEAAQAYLVNKGIDAARIETDSRGDSDPRVNFGNAHERKTYNRVDVYFHPSAPQAEGSTGQ